jgi:hypothetical protein
MSISAEAIALRNQPLIRETPRNENDRDRLREEWRLISKNWSHAEDNARRLEEGRKILMSELKLALIKAGSRTTLAEDEARTSEQFKQYVRRMHDARRVANDLKIEMENADRLYWSNVTGEANERTERRMSR